MQEVIYREFDLTGDVLGPCPNTAELSNARGLLLTELVEERDDHP